MVKYLKHDTIRSLIVVYDDFHLPRIMLTLKCFLELYGVEILACRVPPESSMIDRHNWYHTKAGKYIVVNECIKRIFYKMFFNTLKMRFT